VRQQAGAKLVHRPPKVITRIWNVLRGPYGTFTAWATATTEARLLTGKRHKFDAAMVTAYHVTRKSPAAGTRHHAITCDTKLGRLATASKQQDWISLPTNTGLMLPPVKIRPWVCEPPTAYERVWVIKGEGPGIKLSAKEKYIPYLVQFELKSDLTESMTSKNHWFYSPLTEMETIKGDSGCPVLTDEGILVGFNVAENLFTAADKMITDPGSSSWIDCHYSFNSAAALTSNQQCCINSLLAETDMHQVKQNRSLPEIYDLWDSHQSTGAEIMEAVDSTMDTVLKKAADYPGPIQKWPSEAEFMKARCRINALIPAT